MKKLLVSCDEYVYLFNGRYFLREFGNVLLSRYLEVFDKIRFAVRTKVVHSETELGIYNIPVIDDRIEIYPIPFFQGPKEYAKSFFQVKKAAKRTVEKCDAAIIRVPSTIGFVILNEVRKKKIPYAVEVVANPSIEIANSNNILVKFLMKIIHRQQLIACKHADGASYVTQNALQKIYPAKKRDHFESYYSSVELPNIFFKGSRKYPKHNPFIICHVANPIKTYNKGHITVIDTIKLLKENGFDVIAKFAGEGEFISRFQEYAKQKGIQDRIYFVGLLKQNELINFLEESDIMLFPTSTSEGLPRVLIEAMATGLPCLSTNISGIPELLSKEQIFAPNDSLGFATRIKEIIQSPNLYEKLSKTAFEKAKEYQSEILQARRIQFYQKLKELL